MSISIIILGHERDLQYFFLFGCTENICVIVAVRGVTLPSSLSSSASTPVLSVNSFTLTAGRGCVVVKSPWVPQLKDTTKDTPEVSFHNSGRAEHLTGEDSLSSEHWLSFNLAMKAWKSPKPAQKLALFSVSLAAQREQWWLFFQNICIILSL